MKDYIPQTHTQCGFYMGLNFQRAALTQDLEGRCEHGEVQTLLPLLFLLLLASPVPAASGVSCRRTAWAARGRARRAHLAGADCGGLVVRLAAAQAVSWLSRRFTAAEAGQVCGPPTELYTPLIAGSKSLSVGTSQRDSVVYTAPCLTD